MSVKEQTLALLATVPDESPAWEELHADAQLLRAIAEAEADVKAGREVSLEEARASFEAKWARRNSRSA